MRKCCSSHRLPLIIEGSNDQAIDSEVFRRCGEAGEGERLLLGTAEAGRYRSIAAAALAYGHAVIAQSPIDINLAKQLNILLREIGVPEDQIVIDPYTGALGYGFEYSYSVMERIRTSALKGDADLAMPIISGASDTLTIKEVREADPRNFPAGGGNLGVLYRTLLCPCRSIHRMCPASADSTAAPGGY